MLDSPGQPLQIWEDLQHARRMSQVGAACPCRMWQGLVGVIMLSSLPHVAGPTRAARVAGRRLPLRETTGYRTYVKILYQGQTGLAQTDPLAPNSNQAWNRILARCAMWLRRSKHSLKTSRGGLALLRRPLVWVLSKLASSILRYLSLRVRLCMRAVPCVLACCCALSHACVRACVLLLVCLRACVMLRAVACARRIGARHCRRCCGCRRC